MAIQLPPKQSHGYTEEIKLLGNILFLPHFPKLNMLIIWVLLTLLTKMVGKIKTVFFIKVINVMLMIPVQKRGLDSKQAKK